MIHQVSGGAQGQASDVERHGRIHVQAQEAPDQNHLASHTGQPEDKVQLDSDRDYFMSAAEAKDYGLVDEVIKSRKEAKLLDGVVAKDDDRDRGSGLAAEGRGIKAALKAPNSMARASNLTMCSFCGKSHAEVRKLIAGPGVYICDSCINVCKSILDKELNEDARRQSSNIRVPKPADIRRSLDQYVIGQDVAKKTLSVAVHNHFKRVLQSCAADRFVGRVSARSVRRC